MCGVPGKAGLAFPFFFLPTEFTAQGDEGDRGDVFVPVVVAVPVTVARPTFEHLASFAADRQDEPSAFGELFEEQGMDMRRGGRDDDPIERTVREQAAGPISSHDDEVMVSKLVQGLGSLPGQGIMPFDGIDDSGEFPQDGSLVAGPGANFEQGFVPLKFQKLGHEGDDVGLRDGLVFAEGERTVGIGQVAVFFGDKAVARDLGHGLEDARVGDVAFNELFGDHLLAGEGVGVFRHGGRIGRGLAIKSLRIRRIHSFFLFYPRKSVQSVPFAFDLYSDRTRFAIWRSILPIGYASRAGGGTHARAATPRGRGSRAPARVQEKACRVTRKWV